MAAMPPSFSHRLNRRLIEMGDAVPEHVALLGLHQQRPLADGEGRLRDDPRQARLLL